MKIRNLKGITGASLLGLAILLLFAGREEKSKTLIHTEEDLEFYRLLNTNLPLGDNSLFTGSGKCAGCHGFDPNGVGSLTAEGVDVNPTDNWRATMMANSAKDPFWKAKVSHEVYVNPGHQTELEDKCTSCHAPMGRFAAIHDGLPHYSMEMLMADSLGLDGVSCNSCHQQDPANIGNFFSGNLEYVSDTLYGPYGGSELEAPIFTSPMASFVGYEPMFGSFVAKSEMCAGCHTLQTNTADIEGELTGNVFTEQATYHEWLNSVFNTDNHEDQCQGCHMPSLNEPIVISSNYAFLPGREPYGQHWFAGANTFMLELMKNRIDELGIAATEEQFDRVIDRTLDLLQNQSLDFSITNLYIEGDSVVCELKMTNLTGHKFPSGYPARRSFVEFTLTGDMGETLFSSGALQADYEVQGQNDDYEPHYDVIRSEDQVQIYEMVIADVNGDVTTVLERADTYLKDNRLVPAGFSTLHSAYDTTKIVGVSGNDLNFNYEAGIEGSGSDRITYKIGLGEYEGNVSVSAKFFYQSLPPKWMDEMFAISTPQIDAFKIMYEEEGPDPVLISSVEDEIFYVGVPSLSFESSCKLYPVPAMEGKTWLSVAQNFQVQKIRVYDMSGRKVLELNNPVGSKIQINLPDQRGTYMVEALNANGERFIGSVMR